MAVMMWKCEQCGEESDFNHAACWSCGAPRPANARPSNEEDVPSPPQEGRDPETQRAEEAAFGRLLVESTPRVFVTPALLGLNVLVFGAMAVFGVSVTSPSGEHLINWGANFGPLTIGAGEWWRLLSSNFIHIGILHILFNMWVLWSLGPLAERLFGNWVFLMVYVMSGIGGSIASLSSNPTVLSAGASGAIFGVVGSIVAFLLLGKISVPRRVITGQLRGLVAFALFNLFYGFTRSGIDNAGHIGGLIMGLALGAVLHRPLPSRAGLSGVKPLLVFLAASALLTAGALYAGRKADDPLVRLGLIQDRLFSESTDEVIPILEELIYEHPDVALAHQFLGSAYYDVSRFEDAAASFREAIALDPNAAEAYSGLAAALSQLGHIDDGIAAFKKAVEKEADPSLTGAAGIGLAAALLPYGRINEAIDILFKVTSISDNKEVSAYAQALLGDCYGRLDRTNEAIAAYREAVELEPDISSAWGNMGWMYYLRGEFHTCIEMSEKAVELDDTALYARYNIALSYLRLRDIERARSLYTEIVRTEREQSGDVSPGAITDLQELIDGGIMAAEAERILVEVFGTGD